MRLHQTALQLAATDLSNHLACRHLTQLEVVAAGGSVKRPVRNDDRIRRIRELGLAHESAYIDFLRNGGCSIVEPADKFLPAADVKSAMLAGADVITQAQLESGRWRGIADVLLKVDAPSDLGGWSYVAVDTKLTSQTRGGTVLQLCLYTDLVADIQGTTPEHMYVVSPSADFKREEFRFADYAAYYRFVKLQLEGAVTEESAPSTYPYPVAHCDVCAWWSTCDKQWRADDHLSLVAGCTRMHTQSLEESGINTLAAFATARLEGTAWPAGGDGSGCDGSSDGSAPFRPRRGALLTYVNLQHQARLQLQQRESGRPCWESRADMQPGDGLHRLPAPDDGDVFFDIEGDRFATAPGAPRPLVGLGGGFEYLFGYATGDRKSGYQYEAQWAFGENAASEQTMFESFIAWVMRRRETHPDMHIYHYNHYEPTALKRLMSTYAVCEDEVDRLLRGEVFVDLYTVVRQSVRVGAEGYSIKDLEQYYDYERVIDLREAASPSLRLVERALELSDFDSIDASVRADVEGYNCDDCLSTAHLRDWLEDRRTERNADGADIRRPEKKDAEPDADLATVLAELEKTRDALNARLPENPEDYSEADRATALLARMLLWFHREAKVNFWEKYRLVALTEDELMDERVAIVGLAFVSREQPSSRVLPTDTYRYPPQEVKLKAGDDLLFGSGERAGADFGKVVEIDPLTRLVQVKKRGDSRDDHPPAIYSWTHYGKKIQQTALHHIAEGIAASGLDVGVGDLVARKLLLRMPPRAFVGMDHADPDSARRLVLELDEDVLAIQGPPGSGKTYLGAQMICDLVEAGKIVGVTATSHAVVEGLLNKTVELARKRGLELRCAHKPKSEVKKDHTEPSDPIHLVTDRGAIISGVRNGTYQVVGGVSWLWAAPDMFRFADVLFVDEAGQMSLAEVLSVTRGAKSLVLLGDPAQLDQPQQAAHPEGTGVSALEYIRGDATTMPRDRGLFIEHTRRLHPDLCALTSELFYEGKLRALDGLERQDIRGEGALRVGITGSGLYYLPVEHDGNQNESREEAEAVRRLVASLTGAEERADDRADAHAGGHAGATWVDLEGVERHVGICDVLVVAPYNAQVTLLQAVLQDVFPVGARVGTVDKFQGKEAPVVIYSLATSNAEDAPRGMTFLYDLNRLNVATSRARCVVVLVANPQIFEADCRTPAQMRLANALARYREVATVIGG